jgi:hypothetical protein
LKDVKKGSLNVCLQYFALTTQKPYLDIVNSIKKILSKYLFENLDGKSK